MRKKPPDAVRDTGDWELEMQWEREIMLVIRSGVGMGGCRILVEMVFRYTEEGSVVTNRE